MQLFQRFRADFGLGQELVNALQKLGSSLGVWPNWTVLELALSVSMTGPSVLNLFENGGASKSLESSKT
jgi:hypothetical protein